MARFTANCYTDTDIHKNGGITTFCKELTFGQASISLLDCVNVTSITNNDPNFYHVNVLNRFYYCVVRLRSGQMTGLSPGYVPMWCWCPCLAAVSSSWQTTGAGAGCGPWDEGMTFAANI